MKNHYKTLSLQDGASQEEIQEAYERLFKELNPSENGYTPFFIEEFGKIQEAYNLLRNSSILTVTSEALEASSSDRAPSTVKKSIRKLKSKTELKG